MMRKTGVAVRQASLIMTGWVTLVVVGEVTRPLTLATTRRAERRRESVVAVIAQRSILGREAAVASIAVALLAASHAVGLCVTHRESNVDEIED